ncbi:MAG TPA: ferrochelatase [Bauldia sp.]|nr:ferrochelatase [Bauldia sp.]
MNPPAKAPVPAGPLPPGHPPLKQPKVGVLLVNLGSPSAPDTASVRRYLRQFLSDRRVIEIWPPLWWLILNLAVLPFRPKKSAHAYQQIWDKAANESPLVAITRRQTAKLAERLAGDGIVVDFAMRYGEPAIATRLAAMKAAGCERILAAPLYPQYAASTTATANDAAFDALKAMRWEPALRTLPPYHDDPAYIAALATSLAGALAKLPFEPQTVIASFHGLPREYLDKGDPYHCQCQKTVRLLRERLGWSDQKLRITFQSRFGAAEWLQPYTDKTLAELAASGVRKVAVVMPGFSADCLETLEEIAIRGADTFRAAGGMDFAAIPCLNDSAEGMALIETLVRRELAGWA